MKNIKKFWLLFSAIALLFVVAGITYAWFAHSAAMSTLIEIVPPDTITIVPISEKDGSEMIQLDLDYHEGTYDSKEENGTIHILRPICIKSTNPIHRLEVAHTTNLNNLEFHIYPAEQKEQEGIKKIQYESTIELSGKYINNQEDNLRLAKEETLKNYNSTADVADIHAYPLYWLANNKCATKGQVQSEVGYQIVKSEIYQEFDPKTKEEKNFYYTYYYLEISWLESTKETDLFYIMAQNVVEE